MEKHQREKREKRRMRHWWNWMNDEGENAKEEAVFFSTEWKKESGNGRTPTCFKCNFFPLFWRKSLISATPQLRAWQPLHYFPSLVLLLLMPIPRPYRCNNITLLTTNFSEIKNHHNIVAQHSCEPLGSFGFLFQFLHMVSAVLVLSFWHVQFMFMCFCTFLWLYNRCFVPFSSRFSFLFPFFLHFLIIIFSLARNDILVSSSSSSFPTSFQLIGAFTWFICSQVRPAPKPSDWWTPPEESFFVAISFRSF